ncbi:MAG TPA: hypothetical protein P5186_01775 [Candidatus Paceibacterota bacterium]|nr:hypothetical protein [Candidatus Paceibacterota bacterium]HSA01105.1 hypothetical protein [Candidatus Paceibacterota bacterium]
MDTTELLILEDGRILVHNLTPEFAAVLRELDREDPGMNRRAVSAVSSGVHKIKKQDTP